MKSRIVIAVIVVTFLSPTVAHAKGRDAAAPKQRPLTVVPDAAFRSLELINRERAVNGLPGLALDDEVSQIASGWSKRLAAAGRLSHNADYFSAETMQRLDASSLGENVAYADTVDRTHELFMKSPPHRRNILDPGYRLVGIAGVRDEDGNVYLTQDFLTRNSPSRTEPALEERTARPRPARPRQVRRGQPASPSRAAGTPPRRQAAAVRTPPVGADRPSAAPAVIPSSSVSTATSHTAPGVPPDRDDRRDSATTDLRGPAPPGPVLLAEQVASDSSRRPAGVGPPVTFWKLAPLLVLALWPRRSRR